MTIKDIEIIDLAVVCGLTVLLVPMMFTGRRITRFEGVILLMVYLGYCGLLWQRINAGS